MFLCVFWAAYYNLLIKSKNTNQLFIAATQIWGYFFLYEIVQVLWLLVW